MRPPVTLVLPPPLYTAEEGGPPIVITPIASSRSLRRSNSKVATTPSALAVVAALTVCRREATLVKVDSRRPSASRPIPSGVPALAPGSFRPLKPKRVGPRHASSGDGEGEKETEVLPRPASASSVPATRRVGAVEDDFTSAPFVVAPLKTPRTLRPYKPRKPVGAQGKPALLPPNKRAK